MFEKFFYSVCSYGNSIREPHEMKIMVSKLSVLIQRGCQNLFWKRINPTKSLIHLLVYSPAIQIKIFFPRWKKTCGF